METLTLGDMEHVIETMFNYFLNEYQKVGIGDTGLVNVIFADGRQIQATFEVRANDRGGKRIDCGVPGYNMDNLNVRTLAAWVRLNIRYDHVIGDLAACKMVNNTGQVNVRQHDMEGAAIFNFHVNLTDPC